MMKKIIALALALSMALSMVAFAGYTDADAIDSKTSGAIELVTALGLMKGNTDGSFNPTGTLTRAEAAVILARLHSGKDEINDFWGDKALTVFTDVSAHWGLKYINYCAGYGLVEGDPSKTFRPDDKVTCVEMAKMLLCLAGYNSEKQQYGAKWPTAAITDALTAGLLNGYELGFTDAAERQWVAKMVANMLDVKEVGYDETTGKLKVSEDEFGAKYGVNTYIGLAKGNDTEAFGATSNKANKDQSKVGDKTIKFDVPTELLGHDVKVYFKGETLNTSATVYAVVDASKKVVETTMDKIIVKANTTTNKTELIVDGTVVDADVKMVTASENYTLGSNDYFNATAKKDTRPVTLVLNAKGDTDASNDQWRALFNKVEYAQVTDLEANKSFKIGSTQLVTGSNDTEKATSYGKINFVDTVAEDDYVAVETVGLCDVSYNVSKLTPAVVKVNSVAANSFTAGTTVYTAADVVKTGWSFSTILGTLNGTNGLKDEYKVYTVDGFVVFAESATEAPVASTGLNMNLALLIGGKKGTTSSSIFTESAPDQVQVVLKDGSTAVYEYKVPVNASNAVAASTVFDGMNAGDIMNVAPDTLHAYVENSDGSIYFTTVMDGSKSEAEANGGAYKYDGSKSYMTAADGNTNMFITADTFFFVKMKNEKNEIIYVVVNASEIKADVNADATKNYGSVQASTGLTNLVYGFLDLGSAQTLPTTEDVVAGDYFILTKELATTKSLVNDEEVITYAAEGINNKGEKVTLTLNSNTMYTVAEDNETAITDDHLGHMFIVTTVGANTVLADFDQSTIKTSDVTTAGWYSSVITASGEGWLEMDIAKGKLIDISADAVMFRITKSSSGYSVAAVTSVPHKTAKTTGGYNNNVEVLVKLASVDGELVVTDVILCSEKSGSTTSTVDQDTVLNVVANPS